MTTTRARIVAGLVAVVMGLVTGRVPAAEPVSPADAALALRLCDLAQRAIPEKQLPSEADYRRCASLLEAARRSDPSNPRYTRLLADVLAKLGNHDGMLQALEAYRKLQPADQVAQLEVIGLYLQRMQTVDQKAKYLADLISRESIPAPVRSALAAQTVVLLQEAGKDAQAKSMLEQALALDPLNLAALELKLDQTPESAPGDRAAILVAMLRSNPAQADVVLSLARLLARHMLVKEAIEWYAVAWQFGAGSMEVLLEYAGEALLSDQVTDVEQLPRLLDQVIAANPQNYEALVLRVLAEKRREKPDAEAIKKWKVQARNGLLNDLTVLRQGLGVREATTRPVDEGALALPDLSGDVARWKSAEDGGVKARYVDAVGRLAWFDVYFGEDPNEAEKLLGIYTQMASDTDPLATRIAGWIYLERRKPEEAKVKLSATAEQDVFAKLGLILLSGPTAEDQTKAKRAAEEMMASSRGGTLAAALWDRIRGLGIRVLPDEHAASIRGTLAKFPRKWIEVAGNPQGFYSVRGEPLKTTYNYGEPLLVRITLQNTGDQDLTIGPSGVIKPTIFVDVQVHGLAREMLLAVCVERFTDQLVLRPREKISRVVRIDQGVLARRLERMPWASVPMSVTVRTNPTPDGRVEACGTVYNLTRMMERSAFPFPPTEQAMQKLAKDVAEGSGDERIRNLELLPSLLATMREVESDAKSKGKEVSFQSQAEVARGTLRKGREDANPAVRAWATYQSVSALPPGEQAAMVKGMLADSTWQGRLLGLVALATLPADHPLPLPQRKELLTQVAKDGEAFINTFVQASLELMNQPAATQPAAR